MIASRIETESAIPVATAARIRAAVLWRSGSQIAGQLVLWCSTFLVLRLLSPADYGLFAMTQVVIGLAQLMNGFSFASSLVQAETLDRARAGQIFGVLIVLNFGLAAAQFAVAPLAADYFRQPALAHLLRVQCLLHLTTPFIIMPQALLARDIDFATQGRANIVAAVAGAIVGPACALAGLGVWTLVFAPLAIFTVRAIMLGVLGRWWVRPRFRLAGAGALLGFGGTVLLSDALWFLQNQADSFIGGRRFDAHQLGLYSEGLFLTGLLVYKFVPALNDVAFPAYARMRSDPAAVARGFARAAGVILLAALPVYAGLAVTAGPLVTVLMGEKWAGAVPIVRILAFAMPLVTLHILYPSATNALGRPRVSALSTGAGAVVLPVAFLIGSHWGPVGMATAWVAAMPVLLGVSSALALPVIGLRPVDLARAILPPAAAAAAMGLVVLGVDRLVLAQASEAVRLLVEVPVGIAAYAPLAWLLARRQVLDGWAMVRGTAAE